jgi:DNA-binding XRE family transcriptional regulator
MIEKDGVQIKVQEVLDSKGMKQNFLCEKTKITTKSMSALCRGESLPSLKNSLKISKALDKKVEDLWVLNEDTE